MSSGVAVAIQWRTLGVLWSSCGYTVEPLVSSGVALGVLWSSCGYTVEHLVSSGVAVAIQWNTWCPLE